MLTPPRRLHVARALAVLQDIASGHTPADQILETLFRRHKEMGKRDRAAVSAMVYGVLRDVGRLQALAGPEPAGWLARWLVDAGLEEAAIVGLELPQSAGNSPVPIPAALNLPSDWHSRLLAQMGEEETKALAAALNQPAPVDVRINTLKTSRDAALAALAAENIAAVATPYSPWGLRLPQRLPKNAALLAEGLVAPQDEGSQLLALLTGAKPGDTVIDWCAGAGGKALALAAMMGNQGRILACDISPTRLAKLPPRARQAGVDIIETHTLRASTPPPVAQADVVLVDAPCSGLGTLRRAPELRLRHFDFSALAALQGQILLEATRHLRPGGCLVYATCSLLAEENEQVIATFLSAHSQFEPAPAPPGFPPGLLNKNQQLRLWPHQQGTDGFFAAALRRKV
jgi:16S rRNA (cytosine967-C5)-methyltransferase